MKLAVITLTLLGFALGAHAGILCGCKPDPRGQVCASNYKTYDSECWMRCGDKEGLQVLWWGSCDVIPGSVPAPVVHPIAPVVNPYAPVVNPYAPVVDPYAPVVRPLIAPAPVVQPLVKPSPFTG